MISTLPFTWSTGWISLLLIRKEKVTEAICSYEFLIDTNLIFCNPTKSIWGKFLVVVRR